MNVTSADLTQTVELVTALMPSEYKLVVPFILTKMIYLDQTTWFFDLAFVV